MAFPATFADLQANIAKKLRLDTTNTAEVAWLKDQINAIYAQVVVECEANQLFEQTTLTANTASYSLSAAISRVNAIILTPADQTQPLRPLERVSLDTLLERRQGAPVGSPTMYALAGLSQLEFSPIPDAADVLTIWFTALPTPLSVGTDVPILEEPYSSKLIEYGVLAEGADFKLDPRRDEYRALFQDWLARYRIHLRRRAGGVAEQIPLYRRGFRQHDPSQDLAYRW